MLECFKDILDSVLLFLLTIVCKLFHYLSLLNYDTNKFPLPALVSLQSAFGNALFIGITGLKFTLVKCFRMDDGNAS